MVMLQAPLARRSASIGQMTERVELQRRAGVDDGGGGRTKAWTKVAEVWARVRPAQGNEEVVGERERSAVRYWVTIHWRAGFGAADRVVWQGQVLNVRTATDPTEQRQELLLMCEGGVQT